ncbi:MAG TPA: hypothetical protein VNV18_00050 [Stellaceae bacterium]|jgi:hypothetical protein|nr:hypothetical protein [Stellaceae bacterium]
MPEYIEEEREPGLAERYLGGWRVIASAWAMAVVFVLLFAGVQALASRHVTTPQQQSLVGAVIPRHDPSCAGPGDVTASATPNCQTVGEALAQAEAEASYGW